MHAWQANFRGLPFEKLQQADLRTNADTRLHERTEPKRLGDVDAFLSHSWCGHARTLRRARHLDRGERVRLS